MMNQPKFIIIPLLLLTLLVVGISGNRLRFPDETEYHQLGQSLASGSGFSLENGQPTAYRPPGYPFLLSLFYKLNDAPLTAKLVNAFLLTATAWGLCRMAGNTLPALFVVAYPVLFYAASTLYPQTLGGFFLLVMLALLLNDASRPKAVCLAGLLLGFAILCIPSFLLTAPVLAWILFRASNGVLCNRIGKVALLTFCTLLIVAPWTWRNYRTFDAFVPVSANSGLNLYLGNSPNAGANTGVNVERSDLLQAVQGMNEIDTDRSYRDRACHWIRSNPVAALKLYVAKSLNYFNFRNELKISSQRNSFTDMLMFITWFPLLGIFISRLFFLKKVPLSPLEKAIYLLVITNVFLSAIFFTRIRFRLPFDLLMILANAIFIGQLLPNNRFFAHNPLTKPEIPL
jgi:hypothetical protein